MPKDRRHTSTVRRHASSARRHAAIMFTDIVGYTSMMGADEDKAFEVLSKNREIHTKLVDQYNGTLIKEMGDGMLASFSLASDAVRCAIDIQKECNKQDIPLTIGIHEGEVVFEDNDVFGDGVNIASRIQEDTNEGCISISGSVYVDIRNKTGIHAEYIGERSFKNVDESIKIYNVVIEQQSITTKELKSQQDKSQIKSIIVLPFVNMSPDPDQEYFSDGLTEEIITDLSHIHDLLVISRSSAMTFKGSNKIIKEIAKEVNVQYVLEGSVRKAGNNLRITSQLIEASTDTHLWAEKYGGTLDDVFEIQEKVSRTIADELEIQLSRDEKQGIRAKSIANSRAYEYYLKAKHDIDSFSEAGQTNAINYLESALKITGEDALIFSGLAYANWQKFNLTTQKKFLNKSLDYANKALKIDENSSEAHFVTGILFFFRKESGNINKAIYHLNRALILDPNNCEALFHLEVTYLFLGQTEKVALLVEKHFSIDPLSFYAHWSSTVYHLFEGRFKQAIEPIMKVVQLSQGVIPMKYFYALILAYNNKVDESYMILDQIYKSNPNDIFAQLGMFLKHSLQGNKKLAIESITSQMLAWSKSDFTNAWHIVVGYSLIGEKEKALDWLEEWINLGCLNYPFLSKYDPFLENIRGEERFKKLMEEVKYKWENFND